VSDEPKEPRLLLKETKAEKRLLVVNLDTLYAAEHPVVYAAPSEHHNSNFTSCKGAARFLDDGTMEFEVGINGDHFSLTGTVHTSRNAFGATPYENCRPTYFALDLIEDGGIRSSALIAVKIRNRWFAISGNQFPSQRESRSE
jgi:hypothetical protein